MKEKYINVDGSFANIIGSLFKCDNEKCKTTSTFNNIIEDEPLDINDIIKDSTVTIKNITIFLTAVIACGAVISKIYPKNKNK